MVPHTPTQTIKTRKKEIKQIKHAHQHNHPNQQSKKTDHHLKTPIAPHFCELYFLCFLLFLLIFSRGLALWIHHQDKAPCHLFHIGKKRSAQADSMTSDSFAPHAKLIPSEASKDYSTLRTEARKSKIKIKIKKRAKMSAELIFGRTIWGPLVAKNKILD